MKCSIVIPVYKNEASLEILIRHLETVSNQFPELEVVFVVDGSPDRSYAKLQELLPNVSFESQLVLLSRNFGSFSAISAGLSEARGEYFAVIAADLQEPPELAGEFFTALATNEIDVVLGQRLLRSDPWTSKLGSAIFWGFYRRLIQKELPPGGIDVFGCNRKVRDVLVDFTESNTSLVGLLLWVGFRRRVIGYQRLPRMHGRSAWSFQRKLRYLKDSVFAFSDLPIRLLGMLGTLGILIAVLWGATLVVLKLAGAVAIPGYTATMIMVLLFGGINAFGISMVGEYIWRNFENSKRRPRFIIFQSHHFARSNPAPTVKP